MKFENCDIHDNVLIENAQITAAGTIVDVKTGEIVRQSRPVEVEEVVLEDVVDAPAVEFPKIFHSAPSQAFHYPTDLTKECVRMAMDYCYTGQPTQLAYVLVCCFAHGLSNSLTSYKAFVRSLMLWGLLPFDKKQVDQIANTLGCKVRTLNPRYKDWSEEQASEKAICMEIGRMFEGKYCRYRY